MNNSAQVSKQQEEDVMTTFSLVERRVPCQHNFQLYVDYGATSGGPWIKIGLCDTEFGLGFLPRPTGGHAHIEVVSPAV
jgi:hypothetical protein